MLRRARAPPRPSWWSDLTTATTPVVLVTQGTFNRTGHPRPAAIARAYAMVTTDDRYREKARVIASELAELGGAAAAVTLIETLVRAGEPVRRESNPCG